MSINLSTNYYQHNKETLQKKKLMKDIKIFLKKKKKNEEYGCECYKIIQKMKNKSLLSIEKK